MSWTRDDDALIASACEGATKCYLVPPPDEKRKPLPETWTEWFMDLANGECRSLPQYDQSIEHGIRALSAWREKVGGTIHITLDGTYHAVGLTEPDGAIHLSEPLAKRTPLSLAIAQTLKMAILAQPEA